MKEIESNIINDYPSIGAKLCSIKYNISYNKVMWIREKFSLTINQELYRGIRQEYTKKAIRKKIIHNVDENIFMNNFTKESVYLLGFIWGDGYIYKNKNQNSINIECVSDDIIQLEPIINKTGLWKYYTRQREGRREQTTVNTSNKELCDFLIENDYQIKSKVSPNKIWNLIPLEYQNYFILGWIDADGCFYRNDKNNASQFYISGSYEQDWSVLELLFNNMNIKYNIQRIINKKSKYSCIRVTNKNDIIKIGNYIYIDIIPLRRKFEKFLKIKK